MVVNPAFLRFVIFPEFTSKLQAPGLLARPVQWVEILSEGACLFVTLISKTVCKFFCENELISSWIVPSMQCQLHMTYYNAKFLSISRNLFIKFYTNRYVCKYLPK